MTRTLTSIAISFIALVHVYWAFGGRAGAESAIPQRDGRPSFEPSPAATLAVAAGLAVVAAGIAASGRATWGRIIALLAGLAFLARAIGDFRRVGLFKTEREGAFARNDTRLYTPLCLALSAGSFAATTTTHGEAP